MDWGKAIKQYRRNQGLIQGALAYELGVDVTTVSRWERGLVEPELGIRKRLQAMMASPSSNAMASVLLSPHSCYTHTVGEECTILSASRSMVALMSAQGSEYEDKPVHDFCTENDMRSHEGLVRELSRRGSRDVALLHGRYTIAGGLHAAWASEVLSDRDGVMFARCDFVIRQGEADYEFSVVGVDDLAD